MKYFLRHFLLFVGVFFYISGLAKAATQEEVPTPSGGIPGQVLDVVGSKVIYFENNISISWSGPNLSLKDQTQKEILRVNLGAAAEKVSAKESLGEQVIEQDLGGTLKKKAPLAYKNPIFRDIKVPRGAEDPLKASGMQASKVSEQNTPEGGKEITTEYPDGSKSMNYVSLALKVDSSFNKKGELVWRNIEGQENGLKYKKTQWQDGSLIREYITSEGIVSVVFDVDGGSQSFSFLKPSREVVKEASCHQGLCEAN